jgi:uncharacterized damage-inducible protein DinB
MNSESDLRALLAENLRWEAAHANFDTAVANFPAPLRGARPPGAPHSAWQLIDHIRAAQKDILDFCVKEDYTEMTWPDAYWPPAPEPPSEQHWDDAIQAYRRDRDEMDQLALDPTNDLFEPLPNGTGQTLLRELVLVADHTAYHVAQIVMLRRLLDAWQPAS